MIICCGEALIDFIPTPDGSAYRPCPGGSILNIAVGLGRMQVPVGFLSRLSNDLFGDLLSDHLLRDQVNLHFCPRIDGQTTLAFVSLRDELGVEPQYAFYATGAVDREMTVEDLPKQFENEVLALHFGSISLVLEPGATALETLMKRESRKKVLTLDPNVRPALISDVENYRLRFSRWVSLVDILRLSQVDFAYLYPGKDIIELLPEWFNAGLSLIILTQGENGSSAYLPNGTQVFVPAPKVKVKDTVGAGDAYFSAALAFLYDHGKLSDRSLISGMNAKELKACLLFASKAAAINCTREGANPPSRHEMD
ncbi:MAG TPA: carbohydrate kinase [Pelolinea sp.]|nr:carbohydrate kinase [Pelolinea sp.]